MTTATAPAHWDQVKRLRDLQTQVRTAAVWDDLVNLLARAQVHFERGELPGPAVEGLAEQCRIRSREIPEHAEACA